MRRKAPHADSAERTAPARMPILASSSSWPWKAMLEMSSETVKPMPATAPMPASPGQLTGRRWPPKTRRVASHEAPAIPAGLPTTYPTTMPSVTGERSASPRSPPLKVIPALERAKSGTIA